MTQSYKDSAKPKNDYERKLKESIKDKSKTWEINDTEDLVEIIELMHEAVMKSYDLQRKLENNFNKYNKCFLILDKYVRNLKSKKE